LLGPAATGQRPPADTVRTEDGDSEVTTLRRDTVKLLDGIWDPGKVGNGPAATTDKGLAANLIGQVPESDLQIVHDLLQVIAAQVQSTP
jgi:hypothetical protein